MAPGIAERSCSMVLSPGEMVSLLCFASEADNVAGIFGMVEVDAGVDVHEDAHDVGIGIDAEVGGAGGDAIARGGGDNRR